MRNGITLRTGAHQGPLAPIHWFGLAAGVLVPVTLAIGEIWSGMRVDDHDRLRNTMSELGAVAPDEPFNIANIVEGGLILVFALTVLRRAPIGLPSVAALASTGLFAILIGLVRCSPGCPAVLRGQGSAMDMAHGTILFVDLIAIVAMVGLAGRAIIHPQWQAFRRFSQKWWRLLLVLGVWALVGGGFGLRVLLPGLAERLFFVAAMVWLLALIRAIVRHRNPPRAAPFPHERLQSNVMRGERSWVVSRHVYLRFPNADSGRCFLTDLLDGGIITPEVPRGESPGANVTVGFTFEGLRTLRPELDPARLPDDFVEGMEDRAERVLGDDLSKWHDDWRQEIHMVAWASAASTTDLDTIVAGVRAAVARSGVDVLFERDAEVLPNRIEHFGFADGISQPWLDLGWTADRSEEGPASGGKLGPGERWQPIARGEFLLGEFNERHERTPIPEPVGVFRHGTYLVIRQLEQDVERFRSLGNANMQAKLMGREKDGTPLAKSRLPAHPDQWTRENAFDFADDPLGFDCPLGAHVRRANPRRTDDFDGQLTTPRRIIRRGMPYGPLYDDEPGADRGLMFVAINARIKEQFEFIQQFWLNDGDRQRQGRDPDPVAGNWSGKAHATVHDPDKPEIVGLRRKVTIARGGAYFFVPSMGGLRQLASGESRTLPQYHRPAHAGDRTAVAGRATVAFNLFTVTPAHKLPLQRLSIWNGDRTDWYADNLLKNLTLEETLKTFDVFHTARWIDLGRLKVDVGQPPESRWHGWSIFCGVFNGEWDSYIRALWDLIPEELHSIWGQSQGWPGFPTPGTATAIQHWLVDRMPPIQHFYAAYPEATSKEIRGALRLDRELHSYMWRVDEGAEDQSVGYERLKRSLQHNLSAAGSGPAAWPELGNGTIQSLATFSPVPAGDEDDVLDQLAALDQLDTPLFSKVPGTHFARLFLIDRRVDDVHRPELRNSWLVFVADHDGDTNDYLMALDEQLTATGCRPWQYCYGAEGHLPTYLRRCRARPRGGWALPRRLWPFGPSEPQIVLEFFDYPDTSLEDVLRSLHARERLGDVVRSGCPATAALEEARKIHVG